MRLGFHEMLLEHFRNLRVACELRRASQLSEPLDLDRVRIGEVFRYLLGDLARHPVLLKVDLQFIPGAPGCNLHKLLMSHLRLTSPERIAAPAVVPARPERPRPQPVTD